MAPKKKEQQQKMSLGAFLNEEKYGGSWADEVEEVVGSQPLPPSTVDRKGGYSGGGYSSYGSGSNDRAYAPRDSFPTQLPTKPPYTAHLGNLSYEATSESVTDFFVDCEITSVRIIEDRIEQRPKGFAYAEFATLDGLKKALSLDGNSFQGRTIKVRIADPPKERDNRGDSARDLSSWERKGPLADDPSRNSSRRPNDFGERRTPSFREGPADDGKVRDFGNWERRGPLSPLPQPERSMSRTDSRPRGSDAGRGESFRQDRKASPATWGEGRQEGSRPPREFRERPERPERPERAPTAAELDNQWRNNMRRDTPAKSSEQSREGSEAPPSPAGPAPATVATGGRPRLQLAKRTVAEAPDVTSPSATGDVKASPFGAARPIDTAAKEREIADKRDQLLKEKKEADEKAKEERRLAKEAAAKEAAEKAAEKAAADAEKAEKAAADAEKAAAADAEKAAAEAEAAKAEAAQEKAEAPVESKELPAENAEDGAAGDQKPPSKPKEGAQNPKSRAAESGNWRTAAGEQRQGRGGYVNAPRGRGDGRGRGGAPRGPRGTYEGRGPRVNGTPPAAAQQPTQAAAAAPEAEAAPTQDPDGWTTVSSKPSKGRRQRV
ncbi:putative translation initiation factor 4B [Rosellinia necatrix]|uniref:Putative translation initiation factor 4B n=1 Tax=Rosellinia necatrix TaxID=77044 RepID=A0A1W2TMS0_ROSNE|nr:putative translation initiation factor 4B [Rosellinia necatrix]